VALSRSVSLGGMSCQAAQAAYIEERKLAGKTEHFGARRAACHDSTRPPPSRIDEVYVGALLVSGVTTTDDEAPVR
jgi:hypothetical protein